MESHRIRREAQNYPEVKEVIPIVREEKNRGEWKRGLVLVLRRVVLRHEGHTIERPLNLVTIKIQNATYYIYISN